MMGLRTWEESRKGFYVDMNDIPRGNWGNIMETEIELGVQN